MYSTEALGNSIFVPSLEPMHATVPKLAISKAKEMGKRCQQIKPPQTLFARSISGWHQELGSNPSYIHTKPRLAPKGNRDEAMRLKHSGETSAQHDFPQGAGGCSYKWDRSKCCRLVDTSHNCNLQRADVSTCYFEASGL